MKGGTDKLGLEQELLHYRRVPEDYSMLTQRMRCIYFVSDNDRSELDDSGVPP